MTPATNRTSYQGNPTSCLNCQADLTKSNSVYYIHSTANPDKWSPATVTSTKFITEDTRWSSYAITPNSAHCASCLKPLDPNDFRTKWSTNDYFLPPDPSNLTVKTTPDPLASCPHCQASLLNVDLDVIATSNTPILLGAQYREYNRGHILAYVPENPLEHLDIVIQCPSCNGILLDSTDPTNSSYKWGWDYFRNRKAR